MLKNPDNSTSMPPLSQIGTLLEALPVINTKEWCGCLKILYLLLIKWPKMATSTPPLLITSMNNWLSKSKTGFLFIQSHKSTQQFVLKCRPTVEELNICNKIVNQNKVWRSASCLEWTYSKMVDNDKIQQNVILRIILLLEIIY